MAALVRAKESKNIKLAPEPTTSRGRPRAISRMMAPVIRTAM
jgi:hypothetical protein